MPKWHSFLHRVISALFAEALSASGENNTVEIVIPVVVILVLAVLLGVVLFLRRRGIILKRKQQQENSQGTRQAEMNMEERNTPNSRVVATE